MIIFFILATFKNFIMCCQNKLSGILLDKKKFYIKFYDLRAYILLQDYTILLVINYTKYCKNLIFFKL